jgi:uncharacterized phage-associated protein
MGNRSYPSDGGSALATALDAARYLLANQDQPSGDEITNLKLQKLLYYAQGYHLALFGTPLFPDEVKAWDHGPVIRSVYDEYKQFDRQPIAATDPAPDLPDTAVEILDSVIRSYGQFTAGKLRDMTHLERPWLAVAKNHGTISQVSMELFFRAVLSRPSSRPSTVGTMLRDPSFKASLDRGLADVASGRRIKWGPGASLLST